MENLNIVELKDILNYIIENNIKLQANNKKTTAIEIIGESGIGKTSSVMQLAQERDINVVKLNLSQIEELGDLVGFPMKEFRILNPTGNPEWVSENLLKEYLALDYILPANVETRMSYATPAWLPKEDKGGILILDDWNRADPRFIQAIMELIDRGEYISWKLPPNWTICLTANPDNGDYNVQSIDNAQRTRFISFDLDFNKDVWAQWAEEEGIDGRCINFILMYPEVVEKEAGIQKVNARSLVTFFNTISGLSDFSKPENLVKIDIIAKGCFNTEENIIGRLFTLFINNKLDKLIQPDKMLLEEWDKVSGKIKKCVYDDDKYRADIASALTTRLFNYIEKCFKDKSVSSDIVTTRLLDIIKHDETLLAEDLLFTLIKNLISNHPTRANKLASNPLIMKKVLLS